MKYDIVYILKNNIDPTELIYSVRSVCKNFDFNSIWFAGGTPEKIKPDHKLPIQQQGKNKWTKVSNTIREICLEDNITDNFWLFNDDFFIMRKIPGTLPYLFDGTIYKRINELNKRYRNQTSIYAEQLTATQLALKNKGYDTLNYALHVPMLINKEKALQTLNEFHGFPMFRSLYGNHHEVGGITFKDVKIYDLEQYPEGNEMLLSTTDDSFKNGIVGKYIRKQFPDKCAYET